MNKQLENLLYSAMRNDDMVKGIRDNIETAIEDAYELGRKQGLEEAEEQKEI